MIKLSDYIAKRLKEHYNVSNYFMVSGGGAMHLNDSLGHCIPYIANHHEQGCAFAAEGYARIYQNLAVVNVTTGPGGLNCLNGVFGQWTDSVPVLYISGQVKYTTTIASCSELKLRQLGDQEVDIISCVKPLTKYAKMVTNPTEIKYHLDKAIYLATHGRKGPVWLDIPMNIQSAIIDENKLKEFVPPSQSIESDLKISEVVSKLKTAKRPLIVAGHGIRLAKQENQFLKFLDSINIPVVTTFNGVDLVPSSHKNFCGRIGTIGQRAGNFTLQNADVILFLGTRNNIRQVSYNWENFAKNAYRITVDIDSAELTKPLVKSDLMINIDLNKFLPELIRHFPNIECKDWLEFSKRLVEKYDYKKTNEYHSNGDKINVYDFVHKLSEQMNDGDILVSGNGSASVCFFQTAEIKNCQRVLWNSGDASMGYDLPAAIGACIANDKKSVICLTGDGSIMMNLQELETISFNKLPIKIFLINNSGYASIRQTQRNFFDGHMTASGIDSGVGMPNFEKLADGFGISYVKISEPDSIDKIVNSVLSINDKPLLCEVFVDDEYSFSPKLSARTLADGTIVSPSLEDMFPFLDRKEFEENIIKV